MGWLRESMRLVKAPDLTLYNTACWKLSLIARALFHAYAIYIYIYICMYRYIEIESMYRYIEIDIYIYI